MVEPDRDREIAYMLQCLTTEQSALQTARSAVVFESNGRINLFLSTVSSAVVALAFIGQASALGAAFMLFSLVLLPCLFFMGVVTFVRTLQSRLEDFRYARELNRIRHFYRELVPAIGEYLLQSTNDDTAGLMENLGGHPTILQLVFSSAGMVAVISSVIIGLCGSMLSQQFGLLQHAAIGFGAAVFVLSLLLHMRTGVSLWNQAEQHANVRFPSDSVRS